MRDNKVCKSFAKKLESYFTRNQVCSPNKKF